MSAAPMFSISKPLYVFASFLCLFGLAPLTQAQSTRPTASPAATLHLNPALPTVFIAGDSTAQPGSAPLVGWGKPFAAYIDPAKANYVNFARGGRSSRSYITEGIWDNLLANVKPGDYVLIQFGHNDGGDVASNTTKGRPSVAGLGDETAQGFDSITNQPITVHSFGYYMKKMVADTKSKGATPILVGPTVRGNWVDGKIERGPGQYAEWTKAVAKAEKVAYVDLTNGVADEFQKMGPDAVAKLFPRDTTHTGAEGAAINAEHVIAGVKALHRQLFIQLLSLAGREVEPAPQEMVMLGANSKTGDAKSLTMKNFVNEALPADPKLPSIILIGDSTVRNGRADGNNGQWGWGEAINAYFDPAKVNLVNRALGGTSSHSFMNEWPTVLDLIKPGDLVLIQFGTNGDTGSPKGIGEETAETTARGGGGTVVSHTYGWYLRKYVSDIKAKGATPLICTLVPRNTWKEGKFTPNEIHADWARQVAKDQNVGLLDLNTIAGKKYEALGQEKATAMFADGHVHTGHAGAELLAASVIEALEALPGNPIAGYLRPTPAANW